MQFALHLVGQLAAPAAHQLVTRQRQAAQVQAGFQQCRLVVRRLGVAAVVGVAGELFEVGAQFAFGL
ncbi:hypothetical protein D3C77_712360 [compost metagenome]